MGSSLARTGNSLSGGPLPTLCVQFRADFAEPPTDSFAGDTVDELNLLALMARGVVVIDGRSFRLRRVECWYARHRALLSVVDSSPEACDRRQVTLRRVACPPD